MGRSQVERNRRLGRPGNRSKKGDSDADSRSGHVNKNPTHVVKNRNAWRHDNSTMPETTTTPLESDETTKQEFLESEVHSFTMAGGSYYVGDDDAKYNDDPNPPPFDKISRIFEQPQDIDNISKTLSTMLVSERLRIPSHLATSLEQPYHATIIGKDDNFQKKQQQQQQENLDASAKQVETNNNISSSNDNNSNDVGRRDHVDKGNDNNEDDTKDEDNDELEDWLDSVIA